MSAATGSIDEATWDPPLNVVQTDDGLTVFAALAGVDPASVEVRVEDGLLVIEGDRPPPEPGDQPPRCHVEGRVAGRRARGRDLH